MSLDVITKLKASPKIKSITVTDDKKLILKWSKVEGAEKYGVKRALSDCNDFEHIRECRRCRLDVGVYYLALRFLPQYRG